MPGGFPEIVFGKSVGPEGGGMESVWVLDVWVLFGPMVSLCWHLLGTSTGKPMPFVYEQLVLYSR